MNAPRIDPVLKEYSEAAQHYDQKWSFYLDATTRETLARLPLRSNDRLLDVGCGTGELLMRVAARHPDIQLSGIDPVQEMLDVARGKLSAKVDLQQGWANGLPWEDGSFDVVVSCNMFHYIAHPVDAIREMERVLRPGGSIVITDWCDDYLACRLCSMYLHLTSRAHYKTYRQSECIALLEEAGHAAAKVEHYKINWLWGLMTAVAVKRSA